MPICPLMFRNIVYAYEGGCDILEEGGFTYGALFSLRSPRMVVAAISALERLPDMQEFCSAPVEH